MSSVLIPRPDDRPPQREDWSTGVTISIIAHASLIGALVWGLHWRSSPDVVAAASAELWAAIPEAAAPPPVEPPPPVVETPSPPPVVETPKPPDIVTEKIEEKKKPPLKPTPPPPPPPKPVPPKATPAPPPPPKLDDKALAKLHDENMKRMMGQMDAPATNTGRAAHSSGQSANWYGRIATLINQHLVYAGSTDGLHPPEIQIRLGVDGTILSQRITKSSGNATYDDAVLRAVIGTHALPRDTDGTMPTELLLAFNP